MFLRRKKQKKCECALGIDLGSSQIKAAVIRQLQGKLELVECAVRPLPLSNVNARPHKGAEYTAEVQRLLESLATSERRAFVTISCSSAMVCQTDVPAAPLADIKRALKLNSLGYLRRDFSSYYLDVSELQNESDIDSCEKEANNSKCSGKLKVLVGGAQKEEVDAYRDALVAAKVKPEVIELAAVSVISAFQMGHYEHKDEVIVLVDIGARMTSIDFLLKGIPIITRLMHFGGAQISDYIGQILMLPPAEAEEEKRKTSAPIQNLVKTAISPLAREIRSSIDFFERQHERHVNRILACGGTACSPQTLALLSEAVGGQVECWNPLQNFDVSSFNGELPRILSLGPCIAAAIGVAAARLS